MINKNNSLPRFFTLMLIGLLLTGISGCSSVDVESLVPDNRPDYRQSRTTNPLEIPPDLTQSSIDDSLTIPELSGVDKAALSDYQQERSNTQSEQDRLAAALRNIHSDGNVSWLEMTASPSQVFDRASAFWLNNGLPLVRQDKNIGIMETDWLQANGNLPSTGITGFLNNIFSGIRDSGIRDKFRTRIDYHDDVTYVYLTHYGATEEAISDANTAGTANQREVKQYAWAGSSRNPELEIEMLRRLSLYLLNNASNLQQIDAQNSQRQQSSLAFERLADGTPALVINGRFNEAWVLLGVAIDRSGYELTRQNRQSGTYQFAKIEDKETGFLIKRTERQITRYEVGLADQGNQQIAVVKQIADETPTPDAAQALLQQISQAIQETP
ncbi:outer membrane protein assembly factor BamC [Ostreibacterium oceani]|nr:outer membrane protein assembly factor BamC [Ostreibacterium oceani]